MHATQRNLPQVSYTKLELTKQKHFFLDFFKSF